MRLNFNQKCLRFLVVPLLIAALGYFLFRVYQLFMVLPNPVGQLNATSQPKAVLPFNSASVAFYKPNFSDEELDDQAQTSSADSSQPELIKSCLDGSAQAKKEYEALVARLQFENESTIALLYQFEGPEQKLFKALFPRQAELELGENLLLVKEYLAQNPQSKVAHWNLLLACASDARQKGCDAELEQNALSNDPANGQLWMNVAVAQIESMPAAPLSLASIGLNILIFMKMPYGHKVLLMKLK
jgi:hypothetical protein